MTIERRKTAPVTVGGVVIGGDAPIAVQSMCSTDTHDMAACLAQTEALEAAGCDIVRLAAPDKESAATFAYLKEHGVTVPLVADIHFDYRIALECAAAGADKIRINPGNIGDDERVRAVVMACRERHLPIRIGVNSGSLEKELGSLDKKLSLLLSAPQQYFVKFCEHLLCASPRAKCFTSIISLNSNKNL